MELKMGNWDCGILVKSLLRLESECGDIVITKDSIDQCLLIVIDVLGHGAGARKVAIEAKSYIDKNYSKELIDLMEGLHLHLKGSRGAVAAFCRVKMKEEILEYVGIGNISVRVLGPNNTRMVSKDGIVGYMMSKPTMKIARFSNKDILVMNSDGIKENFSVVELSDLLRASSQNIAEELHNRFGKQNDDASCLVFKYKL